MLTISIIICFTTAVLGYFKDKKVYGVTGFLGLFFGIILLLTLLQPFPVYESNDYVYKFIAEGVLFYFIGTLVNGSQKIFEIGVFSKRNHMTIKQNFYNIALVLVFFTFIPMMFGSIMLLLQGHSMGQVYYAFAAMRYQGDATLRANYLFQVLYEFVGKPLAYYMVPLSITLYGFTGRKKFIFHSFALSAGFLSIGFQRSFLIYLILYIILLFIILSDMFPDRLLKFVKKIKEIKRQIIFGCIVVFSAFFVVSISRASATSGTFSIGHTAFYYYCACPKLFDFAIQHFNDFDLNHTWGLLSFRGFFSPFFSLFEKFGIVIPLFNTVDDVMFYMSTPMHIAPSEVSNSFVTMFFTFFADCGEFGVCLFSTLIGYLAKGLYNDVISDFSVYSVSRFIFFFTTILFFAQVNCSFLQIGIAWGFVISRFFFPVYKHNENS